MVIHFLLKGIQNIFIELSYNFSCMQLENILILFNNKSIVNFQQTQEYEFI